MSDTRLLLRDVKAELVGVGWPDAEGTEHGDDVAAVEGGMVNRVDDDLGRRDAGVLRRV